MVKAAINGFGRIGAKSLYPQHRQRRQRGRRRIPLHPLPTAPLCRPHAPTSMDVPACAGRLALRIAVDTGVPLEVVHVNEPSPIESSTYLLKYDSVHGERAESGHLNPRHAGEKRDAAPKECTRARAWARLPHARRCSVPALTPSPPPSPGTWPHGVEVEGEDRIAITKVDGTKLLISYSTATSPAEVAWGRLGAELALDCSGKFLTRAKLAPYFAAGVRKVVVSAPVKDPEPVLNIVYGINHHLYDVANDHTVVDAPNSKKSDLRRARSALVNLAPTSTGSATAIALIFPELKGILGYEEKPLVSTDYINDNRSGIVDALSTQVIDGTLVKVYAWYDNEWGYSARFVDVAAMVARSL
eukprot:scaffold2.g6908.t1